MFWLRFLKKIKIKKKADDDVIDKLQGYKDLIENPRIDYDKEKIASHIIAILVEYLNYKEAVLTLESKNEVLTRWNNNIEDIYIDLYREIFKGLDKSYDIDVKININEMPILLSTHKNYRILKNMYKFIDQDKVFSWEAGGENIQNHFMYPMNIVVCKGANHSQFAARMKNQGETNINKIYDFSKLYSEIEFKGKDYIKKSDGSIVKQNYKNDEELWFVSGVIFEMSRYLLSSAYVLDKLHKTGLMIL